MKQNKNKINYLFIIFKFKKKICFKYSIFYFKILKKLNIDQSLFYFPIKHYLLIII